MNYTLHQLQVFLKIVETNSITKAAEALLLTQPAVSIQFKNLQDQFDIPLMEVIGRKIHITDFGHEVAKAARKIMSEVDGINNKSSILKGQLVGKLKISVVSTGKYIMPHLLSDFLTQHKEVKLELDVTNRSLVIESLEKNLVDFSLVSLVPDRIKLDEIELLKNKLYLVANPKIIDQNDTIKPSNLSDIPLILRELGSGTRLVTERYMQSLNTKLNSKLVLSSNEAVKQAVIAGLGYSIMPLIGIKNELQNGQLKIIPVKGFPLESHWKMVWLKQKKFSPVAKAFYEYMLTHKEILIKENFSWYEAY